MRWLEFPSGEGQPTTAAFVRGSTAVRNSSEAPGAQRVGFQDVGPMAKMKPPGSVLQAGSQTVATSIP